MQTFLTEALPNLMKRLPEFWKAVGDTILMEVWAGSICFVVGLFLGVVLTVTRPGGILERPALYHVLDKLVNLFRSIPFIILLTALMPLSRLLTGTAIYVRGAIVPRDCALFGRACVPEHAIGPCMVSVEGTCAAWYKYGGGKFRYGA